MTDTLELVQKMIVLIQKDVLPRCYGKSTQQFFY